MNSPGLSFGILDTPFMMRPDSFCVGLLQKKPTCQNQSSQRFSWQFCLRGFLFPLRFPNNNFVKCQSWMPVGVGTNHVLFEVRSAIDACFHPLMEPTILYSSMAILYVPTIIPKRNTPALIKTIMFINLLRFGDRKSTRLNSRHVKLSYALC